MFLINLKDNINEESRFSIEIKPFHYDGVTSFNKRILKTHKPDEKKYDLHLRFKDQ